MRVIAIGSAAFLSACVLPSVSAQQFPTKPMRMVVPAPPGGSADIIGRLVKSDELEAGVVAAIIGAPVLIAVARGRRVAGL